MPHPANIPNMSKKAYQAKILPTKYPAKAYLKTLESFLNLMKAAVAVTPAVRNPQLYANAKQAMFPRFSISYLRFYKYK